MDDVARDLRPEVRLRAAVPARVDGLPLPVGGYELDPETVPDAEPNEDARRAPGWPVNTRRPETEDIRVAARCGDDSIQGGDSILSTIEPQSSSSSGLGGPGRSSTGEPGLE